MNIGPKLVKEAGYIIRIDAEGIVVSDVRANDDVELRDMHVLTLGATTCEWARDSDLDFVVLETGRLITIDDIDAAIIELIAEEFM